MVCQGGHLINRVGSEFLVTLGAAVALFTSVQSYVGFKICLLGESFSTECAQECLFHLHMFVHLYIRYLDLIAANYIYLVVPQC